MKISRQIAKGHLVPNTLIAQTLTSTAFAQFGQVIEKAGSHSFAINDGNCIRHDALATAEIEGPDAKVVVSIFSGQPYSLPHTVKLVERHPLGSQAFYPIGSNPWLVIVCEDADGQPVNPKCFLAFANQGVNLKKNIWHGVLTPLNEASDFIVVDRAGEGNNLEEYRLDKAQSFIVDVEI